MKLIIHRVSHANVVIDERTFSQIGKGLLLLVGIHHLDEEQDALWLASKVCNMRIFPDDDGKMNRSVLDAGGEVLAVSQFTLYASTIKGNRPSFIEAARPEKATVLYDFFCNQVAQLMQKSVQKGIFGANMQVNLTNDGPVTIIIDSKNKE
jgi:D-aminoacyl-tRNA deacylase